MKIKIAFVTNQLVMGGIEKSLIALLKTLSLDKFDVTLYVVKLGGALSNQLPEGVKVKYIFGEEKTAIEKMSKYIKTGKFINACKFAFYTHLIKRGVNTRYQENLYYSKMLPIEQSEYDLAIAYYIPTSLPVIYTLKNLKAKKTAVWIHSDVTEFKNDLSNYLTYYEKYNYIYGVSHFTVEKFNEIFPHLQDRTNLFYNILNKENIKILSNEKESYNEKFKGFKILTIGRLAKEKGYDLIPSIVSRLVQKGYDVRWYCIGEGEERHHLEKQIIKYKLENNLILLGNQNNPYPYLKDCDMYIQPSRHEAYCITVAEARIFNKPIITTNTGASEQIKHEKTGLIVGFDEQEIYEAIKKILNDEVLRNTLKMNLRNEEVDTTTEIDKFYQMIQS